MSTEQPKGHKAFITQDVDPRAFADHEVNKDLSKEEKIALLRDMYRIRRFEERSLRSYQQGKIGGFLHLYIGQEAVAVGSMSVRKDNDHYITAYRDHGHALAVGMSMNECMAELYGKHTGCSKGKGGSMHFFAPDKNYWGGHGIVGGQTPLGAGIAYYLKYKEIKGCCLCYLGDGAVNQGAYHESLNLASLFDLPVIYVIENNGYSMGTSQQRSSAYPDFLAKRAEGYNIKWEAIHGHVLYEVRAKFAEAMDYVREHSKPMVLEVFTYRYRGHSIADANAEKYRTKEEVAEYQKKKDPLSSYESLLLDEGVIDKETLKKVNEDARDEAEKSADFADQSPYPPEESIIEDVYWTVDNPGLHDNQGRIFFNDDWGPRR